MQIYADKINKYMLRNGTYAILQQFLLALFLATPVPFQPALQQRVRVNSALHSFCMADSALHRKLCIEDSALQSKRIRILQVRATQGLAHAGSPPSGPPPAAGPRAAPQPTRCPWMAGRQAGHNTAAHNTVS